jgi:hypothetical protein
MDLRDVLDVACAGAMLAVVLRWLFRLDLELHWAVCIGAVSLLLEPWITLHLGPHVSGSSVSELVMGTVVAMALLGIAQVLRAP